MSVVTLRGYGFVSRGYSPIGDAVSLSLLLMWLLASPSCADDWGLPTAKSYESVNGTYVFRTTPGFDQTPPRLGRCLGQLYKKVGDELRLEWERYLINNIAPHRACVANSGKYVVTIGEWGNFDELPVVFYGASGALLNVHGRLDQVIPHRIITRAILEHDTWIAGSRFLFGADDATFIVRINVGYLICFETRNGELMDERWKKKWHSFAEKMRLWNQVEADVKRLNLSITTEPGESGDSGGDAESVDPGGGGEESR